jgi:hypothetical protein
MFVAAMNELDLQSVIGRLQQEHSIDADVTEPHILAKSVTAEPVR